LQQSAFSSLKRAKTASFYNTVAETTRPKQKECLISHTNVGATKAMNPSNEPDWSTAGTSGTSGRVQTYGYGHGQ